MGHVYQDQSSTGREITTSVTPRAVGVPGQVTSCKTQVGHPHPQTSHVSLDVLPKFLVRIFSEYSGEGCQVTGPEFRYGGRRLLHFLLYPKPLVYRRRRWGRRVTRPVRRTGFFIYCVPRTTSLSKLYRLSLSLPVALKGVYAHPMSVSVSVPDLVRSETSLKRRLKYILPTHTTSNFVLILY